jgi:outer membrane protein OmpA-like peptidoglycan-associated protein
MFTSHDFLFDKRKLQNITPTHFVKPAGNIFLPDSSWQKVSVVYTAKGSESFLTIANFSKRDITGNTGIYLVKNFFVFIDDVSLTPMDLNEGPCPGMAQSRADIFEQNERHHFLQRLIKQYRNDPPVVNLPSTSFKNIEVLVFPDVLFAHGKATLQSTFYSRIDSLCNALRQISIDSIVVEGHTDNTGMKEINDKLSLDRAINVANEIGNRLQLPPGAIRPVGLADTRPVSDNNTPSGRQENRRVEVLIYSR